MAALEVGPDLVDLALEHGAVAGVVDDVRRELATLLVIGLRGHSRFGVGPVDAPGLEPRQPHVTGRLDHDHGLIRTLPGLLRLGEERHVEDDDGAARRFGRTRRVNSSLMAGCVIASRSSLDSSSANATLANAPRASRPSASRMPSPNRSTSFWSAGCPGSTTARATWSASTMTAPRAASSSETVDLPAPIPPVSPTRSNQASLGRRRVFRGRRFRRLGRGLAFSRRIRSSRGFACRGFGARGRLGLLGRRDRCSCPLVVGVLAEVLAVLRGDLATLGGLLDREADAPALEVEVDDLDPQLLARRDDLLGQLDVVRRHLGDVHEALDAVAHLHERAERHELGDPAVDQLADLVAVGELLPRILLRGLERQRDALAVEIDVEHLHLDLVADLHDRARVVDVLPATARTRGRGRPCRRGRRTRRS